MARDDHGLLSLRLILGAHAVLSVAEAAKLLKMRDAEARDFLQVHDLIRCPDGKHRFVVWGDVVAAIQGRSGVRSQYRIPDAVGVVPPAGRVPLKRPSRT